MQQQRATESGAVCLVSTDSPDGMASHVWHASSATAAMMQKRAIRRGCIIGWMAGQRHGMDERLKSAWLVLASAVGVVGVRQANEFECSDVTVSERIVAA